MTDEQITGELSHRRRFIAVLVGAFAFFVISKAIPEAGHFWLALIGIAAISYCVYIATVIQVWNAHFRIKKDKQRRRLYPSLFVHDKENS